MKYIRQCAIIFSITMAGELLNVLLPFPIPAGVYGLFLLLFGLCTGLIKLEHVEETAAFLLEIMPVLFIPATVGLMEHFDLLGRIWLPLLTITVISTVVVMAVTGKVSEILVSRRKENE